MKKKGLFNGISAKIALLVMGLSGALITGCYKDDGLGDNPVEINPRPVAPATYSIYGTVTDITTGENIPEAQVNCEGKTYQVNDGYNIAIDEVNGSKDVQLTFTAPNYNTITRTITIKEVEAGQSANYSVSVSLKKNVEKDVLDIYKVSFKVVDMAGNAVDVKVIEPVLTNGIVEKQAGSTFTVRTAETTDYKAQTTTVTLPVTYSKESVAQPAKTYEANIYVEKQDDPTPTVHIYGEVYDKRGHMVPAQSIMIYDGTTLAAEPIYNKSSYHFEIEVAPGTTDKTWKIVAEVKDENSAVKQATSCTYNGTDRLLKTIVQFMQFNIDENGKVEKPEPGEDTGESGSVTPDQDVTTGEVTNTVEVSMTGNDAAGEEDKTTMILSEGTIITNEQDEPTIASIVVVRDTEEEKSPSDTPEEIPTPDQPVVQPIVIRAYEGFPDGIQFSKPLEFTFADVYGGQLGNNMKLEYYNEEKDAWEEETKNASVELSGNTYTMKVPHFSKFRASIKNTIAHKEETTTAGTTIVREKVGTNSSLEDQTVNVTYQGDIEGTIFQTPIKDVMVAAGIDNSRAQAIISTIIKNYFAAQGIVIAEQLTNGKRTIPVTVPSKTMVKNWNITPNYTDVTFLFSIENGKFFEFTVRTLSNITVEMGETQSVEHGHSHGDNWNAGGGIIVSE